MKSKSRKGATRTYQDFDPRELMELVLKMFGCIADCDRKAIEIPDEFLRAFGRVRDTLKRKCVESTYSEEDFQKFFMVCLESARSECGLTADRARSLEGEVNQSVQ